MKKFKKLLIGLLTGFFIFSVPVYTYAEVNINNVLNRSVHSENYMWLAEGYTELVNGRQFSDISEDGDMSVSIEGLESGDVIVNPDGSIVGNVSNSTDGVGGVVNGDGSVTGNENTVVLNGETVQKEDITDEQKALLEYYQNFLRNSERGSTNFTADHSDEYGDWFANMMAMAGSKEAEWMNSIQNQWANSNKFNLPQIYNNLDKIYQAYAKNVALSQEQWNDMLNHASIQGSLGVGDNVWNNGGSRTGNSQDTNNMSIDIDLSTSAVPKIKLGEIINKVGKENLFGVSKINVDGLAGDKDYRRMYKYATPRNRKWWETALEFVVMIGKDAGDFFISGGVNAFQLITGDEEASKTTTNLFVDRVKNRWGEFINPTNTESGYSIQEDKIVRDLIENEDAEVPNFTNEEQKKEYDEAKKAYNEKKRALEEEANANAAGNPDLAQQWRDYGNGMGEIENLHIGNLLDLLGYGMNTSLPSEMQDMINNIYKNISDDYTLGLSSMEDKLVAMAMEMEKMRTKIVSPDEYNKIISSFFSDKNVTPFDYISFLNDYRNLHNKMNIISSDLSPAPFNYFKDKFGWDSYRDYIERLIWGDKYGLRGIGEEADSYMDNYMTISVIKEKCLKEVTENVTYYGHFNQDFLWRIEDSSGKEVGVYETDAPSLYITGGSADKYLLTENQRADVYLVTAKIYVDRYYIYNPLTNTLLASWAERELETIPQEDTASSRWVKVWTMTYQTGKSNNKGLKRNSDLWDTQQVK